MRQNWQLWEGVLSSEECARLISLCEKDCVMKDGTIFAQASYGADNGIRKTKIGWTSHPEIQKLMEDYGQAANKAAFNVDAYHMQPTQFGEYSEGSYYAWHHDVDWNNPNFYDRKISIIVQLSDPREYTGGDFEFKYIETPKGFKTQGSVLAFLSYNEHQVTPVTQGKRHSLVNWMEGPRWR